MSISDGFKLWLGKALADVAIFVGVILAIVVVFFLVVLYCTVVDWWKKRRATVNGRDVG